MKIDVLITGEQGTGKSLLAREIADYLDRMDIKVICAEPPVNPRAFDDFSVKHPDLMVEIRTTNVPVDRRQELIDKAILEIHALKNIIKEMRKKGKPDESEHVGVVADGAPEAREAGSTDHPRGEDPAAGQQGKVLLAP